MKTKKFLLTFLLVAITVISSYAQGFHIGIKGGANLYSLNNDNHSFENGFKFGYNLGAFAELNFSKKIGIQPEVLWNQSNYRTGTSFNQVYTGVNDAPITLNYLSIPVLLTLRPMPLISFQIGPQFGILINENDDLFANSKKAFKKGDFSMLGGVQLNLAAFKIGARYVVGLNNLNDVSDEGKWKNTGAQLYIGIRII